MSVAVFYPSRPYCTDEDVTNAIVSNGIETVYPTLNYPPQDSTMDKRSDFMRLIRDSTIETLMVWRGGRIDDDGSLWKSSFELLQKLTESDWAEIKKYPKNIVGYSDASYLLCSLEAHGINCFYGPNYNSTLQCSTDDELKTTLEYLTQALESNNEYTIKFNEERLTSNTYFPWSFCEGTATGRLIGGNLDTIYNLINMKEQESSFALQQNDILFLEENDPNYFFKDGTVKGMMLEKLMTLKNAGVFSKTSGLLLGRSKIPTAFDLDRDIYGDIIDNSQEKYYLEECIRSIELGTIPVLANISCSHAHPMVTLPLGKTVTLDATAQTLTVYPY